MRKLVFSLAAVVHLLLLDQIVKAYAIQQLKGVPPIKILPVFNLAYVENRGCAWGMFQGQVWPLAVFAIIAFVFLVWKRKSIFPSGKWGWVAEHLLYAGILGNLIDRLYHRFVVDMFDFHWGVHHFPCFNVADACISVSAGILLAFSFFSKQDKPAETNSKAL
jgi:signal peptidase II